jgi:FkbM family methyltransferase
MSTKIDFRYKGIDCTLNIYEKDTDYVSRCIRFYNGFYELPFLEYIAIHFPEQHTILDIGANLGNHSLFFSKFMNCRRVFAFEPIQKNIELFQKNLEAQKNCFLYEFALSNKTETVSIYNTELENYGGYSLCSVEKGKSFLVDEKIPAIQLDLLKLENITFMKIDVESHENQVLQGAAKTITRCKPVIAIENNHYYHPHIHTNPEPNKEILESFGYQCIAKNVGKSSMDIWTFKNES